MIYELQVIRKNVNNTNTINLYFNKILPSYDICTLSQKVFLHIIFTHLTISIHVHAARVYVIDICLNFQAKYPTLK